MIVAIHQPQYLPWLGYFDKMLKADVFVLLDDVQYKKNEWQNRNKIRTSKGWQWLTVPVQYDFKQIIYQIKIAKASNWRKDHYHSLTLHYNKAPYFKEYESFFKSTYDQQWEYLLDLNIHLIKFLQEALGIKTKLIKASELNVGLHRTEKLIEICKKLGATAYLSGAGAREYLDLKLFQQSRIQVIFQEFKCPVYNQAYPNFEPCMSAIDLLFNYGSSSLKQLTD